MADVVDQAQIETEMWNRAVLSEHQLSVQSGLVSAQYCDDCGCRIADGRRKAVPGCIRCVECQAEYEL